MTEQLSRLYAALHQGTPGDLDYYAAHAAQASSVLELGAGFGRVMARLAEVASVQRLVGLDLDPGLAALSLHAIVEGDMTNFDLGQRFDLVVIPHGSLWCLLETNDKRRCFECIQKHLEPGGRLVFDVWAADEMHDVADPEDVDEDHLDFVADLTDEGVEYEVFERSTWDRDQQRMDVTYLYVRPGETDPIESVIRQHYLRSNELRLLLTATGFETPKMFGGFDGRPFQHEDDHLVVEATLATGHR